MWRVALACVAAAGCNQVFGLDPASGPSAGDDGSNGSDATPACDVTGCSDPSAPICDPNAHICRVCLANSECGSEACAPLDFPGPEAPGSCVDTTKVAYLDQNMGSDSNACTQTAPCKTLPVAMMANKPFVKFHGTIASNATVSRSVTFLADPGASLVRSTDGTLLAITGGNVNIYDLQISNASTNPVTPSIKGIGVGITGGNVTLEHVRVLSSDDLGVLADLGTSSITIARSTIDNNKGGGLVTKTGTTFKITNTFFTHNGTTTSDQGGVELGGNKAGSVFQFNTLAENDTSNASKGGGLSCDIAGFLVPNNLLVHNQFAGMPGDSSANTNPSCVPLLGNSVVSTDTFDVFGFLSDNDFHLGSGATSAIDKGDVVPDINVDVDDNTRPQGSLPDIGADERMPM